ncbi:uncharacterized protein [Cardiocondyla obscurior]|uniref:uncharacterized protein n=1 Tax=Cardiocondyla obscurior TaxID=286306 RepID=UPI0039656B22
MAQHSNHSELYVDFMKKYRILNHMTLLSNLPREIVDTARPVFLPHYPVIRADSRTTKLRVVFNASAKTNKNLTLNEFMYTGPALQNDLFNILMNWREYRYVFAADVAKMYRQIRVNELDVPYQCIVWRDTPQSPVEEYALLTVTYGTRAAPFLALRVLRQLVADEGDKYPMGALVLQQDTFVDDVLFGEHDKQKIMQARTELISLLAKGGFTARKWASNDRHLLQEISPADHGLAWNAPVQESEEIKILGLLWNPERDAFEFKVNFEAPRKLTKRTVLSVIARLYDPMGWISPIVIVGKIQMQALWAHKYAWDDELPTPINSTMQHYFSSLKQIANITVPRWTHFAQGEEVQLHGFSDASEQAYGAVIYLRLTNKEGRIIVSLLASKTRVAPIKQLSIPRLELQAAVLLARLAVATRRARALAQVPVQCWCDSSIVLACLRQHPSKWKQFIANRVSEIQTLLPDTKWRHVPSESNPADLLSRGKPASELINLEIWWKGPTWLKKANNYWPSQLADGSIETTLEGKTARCNVHMAHPADDILAEVSERLLSWTRIVRTVARVIKFVKLLKSKIKAQGRPSADITAQNLNETERLIMKYLQRRMFLEERKAIINKTPIKNSSKLIALNPFIENGLFRVGGRLANSNLEYEARHPVVLLRHTVTIRIIEDAHRRCIHGGVKLTLSTLRQEYWVLSARAQVKTVVHNCIRCAKIRAKLTCQIMANLPAMRVTRPKKVFKNCGVDYAGPLQVRMAGGRGQKSHACYIVIFVCCAVKAVHLEISTNYSTEAFIAALQRFISRRGMPAKLISDCGTNFRGAEQDLRRSADAICKEKSVQEFITNKRITWQFNPPAAPHFGGLWEAGVKSVKGHLKRIMGDKTPTLEELSTLLCKIEAALNSRLLGPLTDNIDDLRVLTPGHFLTGDALTAIPQSSLLEVPKNRLSRWQDIQQCMERFWVQ